MHSGGACGAGEEAAFAALRRKRLVEKVGCWVRALSAGLGGKAACEAGRAGGDPVGASAAKADTKDAAVSAAAAENGMGC